MEVEKHFSPQEAAEVLGITDDGIVAMIHSGELVGEMSFIDQQPRSATVRAVTDCKLFQIPLKTVEEVLKTQPAWFEAFIKTLAGRIREADSRIRI